MTDDASITSVAARVHVAYQRLLGAPSKRDMVLSRTEALGRYGRRRHIATHPST